MDDRQFSYITKLTTKKREKTLEGLPYIRWISLLAKRKRIPQVLVRRTDLTATCRCKVPSCSQIVGIRHIQLLNNRHKVPPTPMFRPHEIGTFPKRGCRAQLTSLPKPQPRPPLCARGVAFVDDLWMNHIHEELHSSE